MRLHFGEKLHFIDPAELAAFRQWRNDEENLWRLHDQVICSLDSVKPIEGRRGWSLEQLNNYNRERFEDLISASWDLVIIDESTAWAAAPIRWPGTSWVLHWPKRRPTCCCCLPRRTRARPTSFMRLMQLIDRDSFPTKAASAATGCGPSSSAPRSARDRCGGPALQAADDPAARGRLAGPPCAQQRLYEAVTDYVRHGYNQALAAKQRHIGFLMILMQRLVTSSTAAIRTTLEKRQALLDSPQPQANLFDAPRWTTGPSWTGRARWTSRCRPGLGTGEGRSRPAAEPGARNRSTRHRCQGRGAAGADLQAAAGGERPGAEGAGLHRVRADTGDAGGLPGKPGLLGCTAQRQHGSRCARQGAAGVRRRQAHPDLHRCRGRGPEPAVLPRHRQLRHAVEPDAGGAAHRARGPDRPAARGARHQLRARRHGRAPRSRGARRRSSRSSPRSSASTRRPT
jgi:hypothetical protein